MTGTVVVTGFFVAFEFAAAVVVVTAGVVEEVVDDFSLPDFNRFAWTTSGAMAMDRRRRRRRRMPPAAVVGLSRFLMSVMVYFPLVRVSRTTLSTSQVLKLINLALVLLPRKRVYCSCYEITYILELEIIRIVGLGAVQYVEGLSSSAAERA